MGKKPLIQKSKGYVESFDAMLGEWVETESIPGLQLGALDLLDAEKRHNGRHVYNADIKIMDDQFRLLSDASIYDLSKGGFGIQLRTGSLVTDQIVNIQFMNGDKIPTVAMQCRVTRKNYLHGIPTVGLEITAISALGRRSLYDYVESQEAS